MDEWNRHCRSGRQCGSAIQGLDRIWVRYLTDWVRSAITVTVAKSKGYGKLFRHPTAMRRGVGGFRVAQHLHCPVTHDEQAETAGRKRDDALIGERTERFRDGLQRRRVVLRSAAGELDVAVDRDDAPEPTQSEAVVRVRRLPWLGYGKLLLRVEDVDSHGDAIAQRCAAGVPCDNLKSFCRMTVRNHRDVVERRHFVFSVVHQL